MMTINSPSCSFCNRIAAEACKIISGPGVHICDRCVETCQEILRKESVYRRDQSLPVIENALLRCVRGDQLAHPLFEKVREDLDLWVWELGPVPGVSWEEATREIAGRIGQEVETMSVLRGSEDFTLHIATSCRNSYDCYRIPEELMRVAVEVGFSIELQVEPIPPSYP